MNKFKICPECGTKNPPDVSDCMNCDCDLMSVPVTDERQTAKKSSADKPAVKSSLVKICSECGTKNPPDVSNCMNCDCDLMSVPVTDEQQKSSANEPAVKSNLVKICSECGEKNLPNARKCSKCGEDISDVIPAPEIVPSSEIKSAVFVLRSLDDKITFRIERENITVGRENELKDYLAAKTFVSRRHCRFTLENDELFVEDLKSANGTYVNNQKIFQKTKLAKGDEVGLGGAVFNGSRQDRAAYFLIG